MMRAYIYISLKAGLLKRLGFEGFSFVHNLMYFSYIFSSDVISYINYIR